MAQALSQPVQVVAWTAGTVVGAFLFGLGVYAVVSFVLMRPHAARRDERAFLRELLRETILAGVTQPLLPIFYFVGRRMDSWLVTLTRARPREGGVPVVFVHGYMQNRVGFVGLARTMARRGLGPLYGFNYPWFSDITSNAARLRRFVDRVSEETGAARVDLVCHSMGGLVAVEMMRHAREPSGKVRRCITIATPHAGVVWTGPLIGFGAESLRRGSKLLAEHAAAKVPAPLLSIYSTHDNVVHPKETSSLALRGGRDVEVEGLGHFAILFSENVATAAAAFLEEPDPPQVRVVVEDASGTETVIESDETESGDDESPAVEA